MTLIKTFHSIHFLFWISLSVTEDSSVCDYLCDCHTSENSFSVLCSRKSLTYIPRHIPINTTDLDLSFNSIGIIKADSFPELPYLTSLNIQHSNIRKIEERAFTQLPGLQEIHLSHNDIDALSKNSFQNMNSLLLLSLDHNKLRSLSGFLHGLRLESLILKDNTHLTYLVPNTFHNVSVGTLSIDRCNLSWIPPPTIRPLIKSLKTLMWSYNIQGVSIYPETFSGFHFKMLQLIQSGLRSLDFLQANFTVQNLDLSNNAIGFLDLSGYLSLYATEVLTLVSCNITGLIASAQNNIHVGTIQKLDLSHNLLTNLDPALFRHMKSLKSLTLVNNPIQTLSLQLRNPFSSLQMLDLSGITLDCDCRIDWIRYLIQTSKITFHGAKCSDESLDIKNASSLRCLSPNITFTSTDSNKTSIRLQCLADAIPTPDIFWSFTDGIPITSPQFIHPTNSLYSNKSSVIIHHAQHCISVQCIAQNAIGKEYRNIHACVEAANVSTTSNRDNVYHSDTSKHVGLGIGAFILIIFLTAILVVILHRRIRKYFKGTVRSVSSWKKKNTASAVHLVGNEEEAEEEATFVLG